MSWNVNNDGLKSVESTAPFHLGRAFSGQIQRSFPFEEIYAEFWIRVMKIREDK